MRISRKRINPVAIADTAFVAFKRNEYYSFTSGTAGAVSQAEPMAISIGLPGVDKDYMLGFQQMAQFYKVVRVRALKVRMRFSNRSSQDIMVACGFTPGPLASGILGNDLEEIIKQNKYFKWKILSPYGAGNNYSVCTMTHYMTQDKLQGTKLPQTDDNWNSDIVWDSSNAYYKVSLPTNYGLFYWFVTLPKINTSVFDIYFTAEIDYKFYTQLWDRRLMQYANVQNNT